MGPGRFHFNNCCLFAAILFCLVAAAGVGAQPSATTIYPDTPSPTGHRTPNMITFGPGSLIVDMGDRQYEIWSSLVIYNRTLLSGETPTNPSDNTNYLDHTTQKRIGSTAGLFNQYVYGKCRQKYFPYLWCYLVTMFFFPQLFLFLLLLLLRFLFSDTRFLYFLGYVVLCLYANIPVYWAISSNKAKDGIDFSATAYRIRPTTSNTTLYDTSNGGNYSTNIYWDFGNAAGYPNTANLTFRGGPFIIDSAYASQALTVLNNMYLFFSFFLLPKPCTYKISFFLGS